VATSALFINQVGSSPSQGQDPLWARLFLSALPSIFAILLAWMVFSWNRQKDDRRWELENKKAEWQALLELASSVEKFMPSVAVGSELTQTVHDPKFREHLREMTQATLKCVFISPEKAEKIYNALLKVQVVNEESKGHIEDYGSNAHLANSLGKPRPLEAARNVQVELVTLWREIRLYASEDLAEGHIGVSWKSSMKWGKGFRLWRMLGRKDTPQKPL
jgi:hypothetical protein